MKKKIFSLVLALAMCVGLVASVGCPSALASTPEDYAASESFEPMTREEYITEKAEHNGITYAEAEASLEENTRKAIAALPLPADWEGLQTVPNHDTTYTSYGRVYKIYTDESGLQAKYSVIAARIVSNYGSNWIECDAEGIAVPYGIGYSFVGNCTARISSTTTILMTMDGYFEISFNFANEAGISLFGFSASSSVGGNLNYRKYVSDSHIENSPLSH